MSGNTVYYTIYLHAIIIFINIQTFIWAFGAFEFIWPKEPCSLFKHVQRLPERITHSNNIETLMTDMVLWSRLKRECGYVQTVFKSTYILRVADKRI